MTDTDDAERRNETYLRERAADHRAETIQWVAGCVAAVAAVAIIIGAILWGNTMSNKSREELFQSCVEAGGSFVTDNQCIVPPYAGVEVPG